MPGINKKYEYTENEVDAIFDAIESKSKEQQERFKVKEESKKENLDYRGGI